MVCSVYRRTEQTIVKRDDTHLPKQPLKEKMEAKENLVVDNYE